MPEQKLVEGEKIGKYRILEYISEGGTADVYEAQNTITSRAVALKVFKGKYINEARFKREAIISTELNHMHALHAPGLGVQIKD